MGLATLFGATQSSTNSQTNKVAAAVIGTAIMATGGIAGIPILIGYDAYEVTSMNCWRSIIDDDQIETIHGGVLINVLLTHKNVSNITINDKHNYVVEKNTGEKFEIVDTGFCIENYKLAHLEKL